MRSTDYHYPQQYHYDRYNPSENPMDTWNSDAGMKYGNSYQPSYEDGLTDHVSEESSACDPKLFQDSSMGYYRQGYSTNEIPRIPSNDDSGEPDHYASQDFRPSNTSHTQHAFKCRQLPCRTFISTGACPYGDRCVFLHDPCIMSKPVFIKAKQRKSKEDTGTDAFFWPTMPLNSVMGKIDNRNMPHIAQPYVVPAPNSYMQTTSNNDGAVYSMWEHFLDFLKSDPQSVITYPRNVPSLNPSTIINPYTGKKRFTTIS